MRKFTVIGIDREDSDTFTIVVEAANAHEAVIAARAKIEATAGMDPDDYDVTHLYEGELPPNLMEMSDPEVAYAEGKYHAAPEPPEEPPFCDRCGQRHDGAQDCYDNRNF